MAGRDFETGYRALGSYPVDDDQEGPPTENIVHVVPDKNRARWNHIEDLDEFFTRIYQYYQRSGFVCMVLQDILQLVQYLFVVLFSVFLIKCVDYQILFYEKDQARSHKVTFDDAILPAGQCIDSFDPTIVICLIVAATFFLFRLIKVIYNIFKYYEIRAFYVIALKIMPSDLCNMTWHDVQLRLVEVQKEQQMCIHTQELTELDIYHRILRFKNYMIAMANKSLLPIKCRIPFVGEYVFLSTGLKYNLEMILFWGPWSPFENNWHLKSDYRNSNKRKQLSNHMASRIFWIGVANLILSPLIFLWQILYSFFRYGEILKREPGMLGSRRWSLYARLYLRHFNELDHEFNARLNRAYRPAEKYMNIFTSPILVILAKHIAFFAGAILSVFVILTMVDEDFLAVQHVIALMTVLGVTITICSSVIPDEHMVWCPELMMKNTLAHIHYMPDSWNGNAHTTKVRDEFSLLFHYKLVYLFEELLSPLITPFILCFGVRKKAQDIVDFYRNFTVEVTGVGDVCSFAQMDIRKHGNPQWTLEKTPNAGDQHQQAENGKTELSLMHFTLTNPGWKPGGAESVFIQQLKGHAQRDANTMSLFPADNPLINSLHSLSSVGYGYNSMVTSMMMQGGAYAQPGGAAQSPAGISTYSNRSDPTSLMSMSASRLGPAPLRGGLRNAEGPTGGPQNGLLASIQAGGNTLASLVPSPPAEAGRVGSEEFCSTEMSFSALYMHQLHHHRLQQPYYDNIVELHERNMWQNQPNPSSNSNENPAPTSIFPAAGSSEGATSSPGATGGGPGLMQEAASAVDRPLGHLFTPFGGSPSPLGFMQAPPSLGPILSGRTPLMPNIQETEEDRVGEHQPLLEPNDKTLSNSS